MKNTRVRELTREEITTFSDSIYFKRLLSLHPTGILSVVSDTFDLWAVLTKVLPELKEQIMARDGKLVIRPDSGDPVDILCGSVTPDMSSYNDRHKQPQYKGVVELLWDEFGGTTNEQGYKVLDSHVGVIYGDSITPERMIAICERLKAKGFASTNVSFGLGSYTFQYTTRDTFGFAMKATYIEKNVDGTIVGESIFKDPITDSGMKKSAKGLLSVGKDENGRYILKNESTWDEVNSDKNELKLVVANGVLLTKVTLDEIRDRVSTLINE